VLKNCRMCSTDVTVTQNQMVKIQFFTTELRFASWGSFFYLFIYQSTCSITVSNTTCFGLLLNCAVDYNYSVVYLVTNYSV
jgi:hypothetical protein